MKRFENLQPVFIVPTLLAGTITLSAIDQFFGALAGLLTVAYLVYKFIADVCDRAHAREVEEKRSHDSESHGGE